MKKILLASRYKSLLQRNSDLLINWGFNILTTTSGSEALSLHKEHHFDLIISDFELEGMSMGTFCSLVRQGENSQHVPLIITCYNVPERIERAKLIGASAIVLKPIEPIKLLETIGNLVGLNLIRGKRVEIKICVTIKKDGQEIICFSRDISKTGILLKSNYALHIGDRITCNFTLPHDCQVETDGEIIRYMTDMECDNLYGVKFVSMSSGHRKAIIDYLSLASNGYPVAKAIKSRSAMLADMNYPTAPAG